MDHPERSRANSSFAPNWLVMVLAAAFLIVAGATAYLTFVAVRDFAVSRGLLRLPGPALGPEQAGISGPPEDLGQRGNIPMQPESGPTPQPWDGNSRVNILVMGLDYRDWEADASAPRSDTMILISIDPSTRTAGILSIPRDLWVNIPGFQPNKINMANRLGELYKIPGGGPGLAMRTVEGLLGMPVHYYAQVDFHAFERFIDEIEGVKINVPEQITVDPLGDGKTKKLKPGVQVLPGDLALAYARARDTAGGDFDRAERQQQVILGIRDRILSQEMLPTLIEKAPTLYEELSTGIQSNLSLLQAVQLAWLAQQIPEENIQRGVIGPNQVNMDFSLDGQDILVPLPEEIRLLRDEIFTTTGPASPVTTGSDPEQLMREENAQVSVLNGTLAPGLAASTTVYLSSEGLNVIESGNASELYASTTLIDYTGNPNTVNHLVQLMGISPDKIYHRYDPSSQVDIVLLLGEDWANNNPLP